MIASKSIFLIGVFLILLPIMGFPSGWENFLLMLVGVVLAGMALVHFSRERRERRRSHEPISEDTPIFVENEHSYTVGSEIDER